MIDAVNSDLYDVLAYIAFALSPISRIERVETRKERIFSRYSEDEKLQAFLDFVLVQYVRQGVSELDQERLPDLLELKYHITEEPACKSLPCPYLAIILI
jgi:type I restriction enzyme R subunit